MFLIQWNEKETAPLSGEHILVTQLGGRGFGICGDRWQDWCAVVHYWPVAGEEGFYLSTGASDPHDDRPMEFTHWAPLPDERTIATFPAAAPLQGAHRMTQFRKKPVVIEAVEFRGGLESAREVQEFIGPGVYAPWHFNYDSIAIPTLEGTMNASVGDWIIRGVKGEYYPCKPDIFAATYEPIAAPVGPEGARVPEKRSSGGSA